MNTDIAHEPEVSVVFMDDPRASHPRPSALDAADPMITVHGLSNCDTVKRARAWLEARGVPCHFHDFKRDGLPAGQPQGWLSVLGPERLVNRQGTTWRKLDDKTRQAMADTATAGPVIVAQPSLIRRPLVLWPDGQVTVGFDETDWLQRLAETRLPAAPG